MSIWISIMSLYSQNPWSDLFNERDNEGNKAKPGVENQETLIKTDW